MSLAHADFPSSVAFDTIAQSLASNDADRKDAVKKAGAIFAFTLKNNSKQQSWYIDLKKTGTVGQGDVPEEIKGSATPVTLILSDKDFGQLVAGKANAQKLYMGGKLKIKGDVMKATKMEPILKKAQAVPKAKL
ncbi:oleate-induced peroxisomal protein-like protein POX18 [Massariosphaeria phaeospora]|uniref:Oleate-induced peroxisomal protein-like protein POX18 n=1 Tax=Massariosphaeria phaeospora TaxID=100035 RepID=A0A7C8M5A7_9PLEO|nr:oleate-induced peroxisomal protein-like protein POX18 [Massariosphaeria phaeospora]